ncbi:MAG: conjugal transfer protein [Streptosporangiaceae bacterium]
MARRATLDRGTPGPGAGTLAEDDYLPPDPSPRRGARSAARPWGGSGGRWFVWVLRVLAWAVLLVIGYRGVVAIIDGSRTTTTGAAPSASHATEFPQLSAEAYALNFASIYLNFSPATADRRSAELSAYLPPSATASSNELGWDGAGTEHLQAEQVASIRVVSAHSAIVNVLAEVNNKMIELGVPVYASGGALVVSGEPAILAPPARAVLPTAPQVNSNQTTVSALTSQLPPFFRAYASGDGITLGRFLAPGAHVKGLGGAVSFNSIQNVTAPFGGNTRHITVVVNWNIDSSGAAPHAPPIATSPAGLQVTYRMTVVRHGTSWYVLSIGASSSSPGPP